MNRLNERIENSREDFIYTVSMPLCPMSHVYRVMRFHDEYEAIALAIRRPSKDTERMRFDSMFDKAIIPANLMKGWDQEDMADGWRRYNTFSDYIKIRKEWMEKGMPVPFGSFGADHPVTADELASYIEKSISKFIIEEMRFLKGLNDMMDRLRMLDRTSDSEVSE